MENGTIKYEREIRHIYDEVMWLCKNWILSFTIKLILWETNQHVSFFNAKNN
jgi:hypothetical protein